MSGSSQSTQPGQTSSSPGISSDQSSSSSGTFGLNITGTSSSDQTIVKQLGEQLRADSSLAGVLTQIRIAVDNGKATLTGNVRDEQQKRQIESAVQRATGITSVDNQLQVSSSSSSTPQR
jgi:osmotically-inducible protein OsmY